MTRWYRVTNANRPTAPPGYTNSRQWAAYMADVPGGVVESSTGGAYCRARRRKRGALAGRLVWFRLVDARWSRPVNEYSVTCSCGGAWWAPSNRWRVECPTCRATCAMHELRLTWLDRREEWSWLWTTKTTR